MRFLSQDQSDRTGKEELTYNTVDNRDLKKKFIA